jgi:hypothetical protein
MLYQSVQPISRSEAERIFAGNDEHEICNALVGVAFYDSDWKWVQDQCLRFLDTPDIAIGIRSLAATCLGHLARIHKTIDLNKVIPVLESLLNEPNMGTAGDALDDIEMFVKKV